MKLGGPPGKETPPKAACDTFKARTVPQGRPLVGCLLSKCLKQMKLNQNLGEPFNSNKLVPFGYPMTVLKLEHICEGVPSLKKVLSPFRPTERKVTLAESQH